MMLTPMEGQHARKQIILYITPRMQRHVALDGRQVCRPRFVSSSYILIMPDTRKKRATITARNATTSNMIICVTRGDKLPLLAAQHARQRSTGMQQQKR
mmetsp:Transcript_28367/g.52988  ORF Transcript_28367/g.52988 Transcript_28367/m.52988 type:complete len:99 (-) Transcript_28367:949-1245(-)